MTAVRIEDNPIPIFPSGSWLTKKFIAATLISTTDADHNALEIAVKANAGASKMTTDRKASKDQQPTSDRVSRWSLRQ